MTVKKTNLRKIDTLKLDKDIHPDPDWILGQVETIVRTCKAQCRVTKIQMCESRSKGIHLYVHVDPPIDARLGNYLQYLLGDDARRVDFNRARIESGLNGWNKLFEEPGARLRTIYERKDNSVIKGG